jgi:quercetin dioxygenase-like cupin family protein
MTPGITRYRWEDVPLDKVTEMVARKTLGGADLSLTQAYFKKGARVPLHAHEAEILVYVLQGAVRVAEAGGTDATVREGDLVVVAAGTSYQAEVLDDAFLLTVSRRTS